MTNGRASMVLSMAATFNGCGRATSDELKEAISMAREALEAAEWISVDLALPQYHEPVLIAIKKADGKLYVREGWLYKSGSWSASGWYDYRVDTITHWRPRPKPPMLAPETSKVLRTGKDGPGIDGKEIKMVAKDHKVMLWEIAEALHIQDSALSRKLRKTLSQSEGTNILCIIKEIAERKHGRPAV